MKLTTEDLRRGTYRLEFGRKDGLVCVSPHHRDCPAVSYSQPGPCYCKPADRLPSPLRGFGLAFPNGQARV